MICVSCSFVTRSTAFSTQEPSAGRRKVAAEVAYKNSQEIGREILKEEIYAEDVNCITIAACPACMYDSARIGCYHCRAEVAYKNSQEIGREILKEEIYAEAVPKIVERGTKIPPTYIKPISGGRQSSGFGVFHPYYSFLNCAESTNVNLNILTD